MLVIGRKAGENMEFSEKNKGFFINDYSEGAHPEILKRLSETNFQPEEGYGEDVFTKQAKEEIKRLLGKNHHSQVHLVSGGTQANLTTLGIMLKPYESVIAPATAHIAVHETGAIEATGHKINTVPTEDGKITPAQILDVLEEHEDEHMVLPRVIYISNTTEVGSCYTKKELQELRALADEQGLKIYLDGARIGSALMTKSNDLTLEDLAELTDAFYIGGTKNGALLGEAIVLNNRELQENFRFAIKQRGGLMAKGRVLGLQFAALFEGDLFFQLATHANEMADILREGIHSEGYKFLVETESNQLFPILPEPLIEELEKKYVFYRWKKIDNHHTALRLVTSWATEKEKVEAFLRDLKA